MFNVCDNKLLLKCAMKLEMLSYLFAKDIFVMKFTVVLCFAVLDVFIVIDVLSPDRKKISV